MTIRDLLALTVGALEAESVPYMLTGSIASSFHGEPRSTRDIDVVIDPTPAALDGLVRRLVAGGLYVDGDAATSALQDRGQFNAIADAKVDFVIRKDLPFAEAEFRRRERVRLPDLEAYVVTVEDLILVKLVWARETGSDRQLRDARGMAQIAGNALDLAYIEGWAAKLGVVDAWRDVTQGA